MLLAITIAIVAALAALGFFAAGVLTGRYAERSRRRRPGYIGSRINRSLGR